MADLSNTTPAARFHNMPPSMLADAIGTLDAQIKALEAEKEAARMALKSRGIVRADGSRFTVAFVSSIRQSLDATAVKEAMGQQWFDDHSKLAEVTSMRITVNMAALAAAA
jgi:hypothetical protein